jgi:xylulokinase
MILAADIGTSHLKTGVIDETGRLLHKTYLRIKLLKTDNSLYSEINPQTWIDDLEKEIQNIPSELKNRLKALVICGNGPTLIPADKNGKALYNALTWLDRRAYKESAEIKQKSGIELDSSFFLPKILWFKNSLPGLYKQTEHFFSCPEFLYFHLSGQAFTILPDEGFHKLYWTDELSEKLEIDKTKLPAFISMGKEAGTIKKALADKLGLPAALKLITGGPDFLMSILGTGTVKEGLCCDRTGSSEGINLCTKRASANRALITLPHPVKGLFNVSGIISSSGNAAEWFRNAGNFSDLSFPAYLELAEKSSPGAGGLVFVPYVAGVRTPHWNPHAKGAFIGLTLQHTKHDMVRSVMEAVCFSALNVINEIEKEGFEIKQLRVTGRQSTSDFFNQLKADITGKELAVFNNSESELAGCAVLGYSVLENKTSFAEEASALVSVRKIFVPDKKTAAVYQKNFRLMNEAYSKLQPVFDEMQ